MFEIKLKSPVLDDSLLRHIDMNIPYHILFLLEYQEKYQAWIVYKEAAASGKAAFKVNSYYHTDWLEEEQLPLKLEGLSVDDVYENFVRQIAGDKLKANDAAESLKKSVEKDDKRQILQKQIDTLKAKIRKEKQLNKQMKMNDELKKLKKELELL